MLRKWMALELSLPGEAEILVGVSLNSKTLYGTLRPTGRVVYLLAAVDHRSGYVLSECREDEETNRHKAALTLLKK